MALSLTEGIRAIAKQLGDSNKENVDPSGNYQVANVTRKNIKNRKPLSELYSDLSKKHESLSQSINSSSQDSGSIEKFVQNKSSVKTMSRVSTNSKNDGNQQNFQRSSRSKNSNKKFKSLKNYR